MNDIMQEGDSGEMQDRCIACGRWGWSDEVGPVYEEGFRREFHLCCNCEESYKEDIKKIVKGQEPEYVLPRDDFDGLLWVVAANEGALFLESGLEPTHLGFKQHAIEPFWNFPQPVSEIGQTFWELRLGKSGDWELAFCCAEEQFTDMLNARLSCDI